jgi:putative flippase GtrA
MSLLAATKRVVNAEFMRFLIAGGINTAFGYLVFSAGFFFTGNEAVALVIDYVIGAFFNYQSYSRLAFSGYGRRFISFCAVYIAAYFLNYFILYFFIHHCGLNAYVSQLCALVVCPLILYLMLKKFVFSKSFK